MTADLGTTPRKPLTPTQRLRLFEEYKGICVLCTNKIHAGEPWRDEHLRALGLAGTNAWDNRAPVHIKCAKIKDKDDLPRIAKAKRQKMSAFGMKRSTNPLPGGKRSPWKKKLSGEVVAR